MASNAICESPLPPTSRPLVVPLFFSLSSAAPVAFMVVGRVGIEGAAHFPWRHHWIEQWAGWNVDGREAGQEEGQGRGETGGDSGRWAVVQSVIPSLLRACVPPTLSLYSSDAPTAPLVFIPVLR